MSSGEWVVATPKGASIRVHLAHALDAPVLGEVPDKHVFEPLEIKTHWVKIPFESEGCDFGWVERHKTLVDEQGPDGFIEYVVSCDLLNVHIKAEKKSTVGSKVKKGDILTVVEVLDGGWMKIKLPTGMNGFVLSYYEPEWVKPVEHLVMAGDVVAKVEARAIDGAYMVKAAKINVYGGPKKSTEILGHITHGHVIHPIAMEGSWVKVQLHSSAGWILLHEPLIEEISEGKFIVLAKRLPVQPGPARKGSALTYVTRGEKLTSMKHEGAWCNCTLSNGTTTGWVQHYKASFVEKLPEGSDIEVDASVLLEIKHGVALAPFGHWIVHSSSLVVYQAANVESQSLGTVEQGHVFQPLTVQPTWVQLYAPDGTVGWCLRHKAHAEKISEDDTDQEMHLLQNLMIYQTPEPKSKKIGKLLRASKVTLTKPWDGSEWAQVVANAETGAKGWVIMYEAPEYIEQIDYEVGGPKAVSAGGNWIVESKKGVNVREGPTTEAAVIGTMKTGELIHPIMEQGSWVQLTFDGKTGWALKWKPFADERSSGDWEIMQDKQVLKARADPDANTVMKLKKGDKLKGIKRKVTDLGEWVELEHEVSKSVGWMLTHENPVYIEYVGAGRMAAYADKGGEGAAGEEAAPEPELATVVDAGATLEAILMKKKRVLHEAKEKVTKFELRTCRATADSITWADPKKAADDIAGSMKKADCTVVRLSGMEGDDAPAGEAFVMEGLHVEKGQNVMLTFLCAGSDTAPEAWVKFFADRGWAVPVPEDTYT